MYGSINYLNIHMHIYFLKIYLFLERGERREKERERKIDVYLPLAHPLLGTWPTTQACALTGNQTRRPFGSQAGAQSPEPHRPGIKTILTRNRSTVIQLRKLIEIILLKPTDLSHILSVVSLMFFLGKTKEKIFLV